MPRRVSAIATFNGPIVWGNIIFMPAHKGSQVSFELRGFDANSVHAIHIHEFGDITKGCKSLGGHWNPQNRRHGSIRLDGDDRHAGDLINNLNADARGEVSHTYHDPLVVPSRILGRSVVIHEGRDDLGRGRDAESLITGNAGGRMACAIIGRMSTDH